jgi:hypothetical protein
MEKLSYGCSRPGVVRVVPWTVVLAAWLVKQAVAIEKLNAASVLNTTAKIHVAPSIAAILAVIAGTLVCFYGFRLLRPVVFICGFVAGGLVVALIIEYTFALAPWMATASWIGFLAAGFITGCVSLMLYNVGVFLVGALAGTLLAFTLNTSFAHRFYPSQPDAMLVILVLALGLLFGLLAWKLEKPVVIIATSFIGATAVVWGIGYFAGRYPSGADLKRFRFKDPTGKWIYDIPTAWWGYLGANLVLFLVGVYVQYRKTASPSAYNTRAVARSPRYEQAVTPQRRSSHGQAV